MELTEYFTLLDLGETLDFSETENKLLKFAVLSDSSTQQFTKVLKALFFQKGTKAQIYESNYDSFANEVLNPSSPLFDFKPKQVLLLFSTQKYREEFLEASVENKNNFAEQRISILKNYCRVLEELRVQVIVNTFPLPVERQFGNYSLRTSQSLYASIVEFNRKLVELTSTHSSVSLLDCMYLSAKIGSENFFNEKLWVMAKSFCDNAYLPTVAKEVVSISRNLDGATSKCVVVDLDNTLWGGIIADDGLEGIEVGRTGAGESHLALQRYLLSLKQRGYFLAVCSKNEERNAKLPFEKHNEMLLKLEDFSVFIANWRPKSENIFSIAKQLNISTSSIVFLDDSGFERDEVRTRLPDVEVPELPEDPADYVSQLEQGGYFETMAISKEDLLRSQSPTLESMVELQSRFQSFEDYLSHLEMKLEVRRFNPVDLPRIAQLIQRSNQFNVRTQRYTLSQCEKVMLEKEKFITFSFSLKDKLTDYGLIAIVVAGWENQVLKVDELLMSCRVLKRGVEEYLLNQLVSFAASKSCTSINIDFIKTEKNQLARDYIENSGFKKMPNTESYFLDLKTFQPFNCYFKEVSLHE